MLLLQCALHQICGTAQSAERMIDLLENCLMHPPLDLCVDPRAEYDAVAATDACAPASSLKLHLISVRDRMIHVAIGALYWVDTRDMPADGLTKGGIDRTLLHGASNDCRYKAIHEAFVHTQNTRRIQYWEGASREGAIDATWAAGRSSIQSHQHQSLASISIHQHSHSIIASPSIQQSASASDVAPLVLVLSRVVVPDTHGDAMRVQRARVYAMRMSAVHMLGITRINGSWCLLWPFVLPVGSTPRTRVRMCACLRSDA